MWPTVVSAVGEESETTRPLLGHRYGEKLALKMFQMLRVDIFIFSY